MDRRAFLALLLPAATAAAAVQDSEPLSPPSLSALLKSTYWAPDTARTLLILGGEQARVLPEENNDLEASFYAAYFNGARLENLKSLGAAPPRGYALSVVGAVFGRKVARFGQVVSLVPTHRRILNPSPGPPLPPVMPTRSNIRPLLDQLDDGGVKKLLSEAGLGREDVPPRLLPLFDGIQSEPLWLKRNVNDIPFLAMPQERLQSLRLRVSLVSELTALKGEAHEAALTIKGHAMKPGAFDPTPGLHCVPSPESAAQPQAPQLPGYGMVRFAQATPLPSALATETLNRRVSLEGIQSLGQLVERVCEAEGLSLFLHAPMSEWSVEWRGSPNVRTGDVIRAITASTTGTFRECQGSFVLTDRLEPLGPRLDKLRSWLVQVGAELEKRRLREYLPLEWGRFEESDLYPLPLALRERVADSDLIEGVRFSLAQFPDQKLLESLLAPYYASNAAFAPTHIRLNMSWALYVIVPGSGPAFMQNVFMPGRERPVRRQPLRLQAAWPILRVTDSNEAKSAVSWAKQQGAAGVVLDGSIESLQAAIAGRQLPIRALHRLWQALPEDPVELKERTIEKVTVDCLSPTHPDAVALATQRLKRLTALPELKGVLIRDAAPPGYRDSGNDPDGLALLGYTERNQQSFLREHHGDIFDSPPTDLGIYYHPLHNYRPWVYPQKESTWHRWRAAKLREALQQVRPTDGCPCWLEGGLTHQSFGYPGRHSDSPLPGWLVHWVEEKSNLSALWQSNYNASRKLIASARAAGAAPWVLIPIAKGSTRNAIEEQLGRLEAESGEGWQGRYLDFTAHSLAEAQELLSGA